jgi:CheY-like chemotaxis protein
MTTNGRILIIDDELRWRQNFARLIPSDVDQDAAASAKQAAEQLRRFYYELVLLDLSMDAGDTLNRDNRPIQQYLSTKPEGTRYFIISAHIMPKETVDAAYRLGANFVFFKGDMDPGEFTDKTAAAIAEAASHRPEAISVARRKLLPDQILEHHVFERLKTGAIDGYPILESLFRSLAPIGQHIDRRHFVVSGNSVLALFWSRRKGKALSAILSHESHSEDAALNSLAEWLGFPTRGVSVADNTSHHVRIRVFEEPSISDEYFDLPVIKSTAQ